MKFHPRFGKLSHWVSRPHDHRRLSQLPTTLSVSAFGARAIELVGSIFSRPVRRGHLRSPAR
jgi:hypothetical protein